MIKVERNTLSQEDANERYHKSNGVSEYVVVRTVSNESAHFGTYMKIVMTVEEAQNVRDQLNELLSGDRTPL